MDYYLQIDIEKHAGIKNAKKGTLGLFLLYHSEACPSIFFILAYFGGMRKGRKGRPFSVKKRIFDWGEKIKKPPISCAARDREIEASGDFDCVDIYSEKGI